LVLFFVARECWKWDNKQRCEGNAQGGSHKDESSHTNSFQASYGLQPTSNQPNQNRKPSSSV
jgi:hypothetical protein